MISKKGKFMIERKWVFALTLLGVLCLGAILHGCGGVVLTALATQTTVNIQAGPK